MPSSLLKLSKSPENNYLIEWIHAAGVTGQDGRMRIYGGIRQKGNWSVIDMADESYKYVHECKVPQSIL